MGYDAHCQEALAALGIPGAVPGRVITEYGLFCRVLTAEGEWQGELPGRMRHKAVDRTALPAVGDWVALEPLPEPAKGRIQAVLDRKGAFIRRAAGKRAEPQVLAANVDVALLVMGLDADFSIRRLERYLALAGEGGATPVVVLNKEDLCLDPEAREQEVRDAIPGVAVHRICAREHRGIEPLTAMLGVGVTVALLGSSGAGKSTLINALLGTQLQETGEVRGYDGTGRHTTTRRELLTVPTGGMLLDTPGLRELQLWGQDEVLAAAFEDLHALAATCRFSDCTHSNEPGCAVQAAIANGTLEASRLEALRKLQLELANPDRRTVTQASAERRKLEKTSARKKAPARRDK